MSIAVGRIGSPAKFAGGCDPAYEERRSCSPNSPPSSSSSIGTNSDGSPVIDAGQASGEEDGEEEVQSKCKKESLDSMDSLEESLPIRRGISSFYNGKSKSFASLMDAMCSSSAKDLGKPETSSTRKRKNLLAYKNLWERPINHSKSSSKSTSKRPTISTRSTFPLAVSISSSNCKYTNNVEEHNKVRDRPPLPPSGKPKGTVARQSSFFQKRSYSLTDLHSMVDLQPLNSSCNEKQRRLS